MIAQFASDATAAINWSDLHLSPIALDLGFFKLRWYSIAYISGILVGWWYLLKLLAQPGAPMARRHADDLVFYVTLGIILGGRIGYILFYKPEMIATPFEMLKLWEGGMSLHGGFLGVILALLYFTRKHRLNMMRICDYVACVTPFGLFFGRLANFVNGELWGRPTTLPWGIIFPATGDGIPRHPSQLYEAGLEGIVLFAVLNLMFWKTDARYQPGKLVGTGLVGYGLARTLLELVRQPDAGLEHLSWGLTMGQTLSIPMILVGLYLVATAKARRVRVEGTAGLASVA
ncbi:prolipoprotein diacylglyceryl transferase [Sphingomonas sp.]|uniref:prolipoprotein diacylglyceryl transferase n=1 Tax=Sphingomonas sp. TaxID=28214 RepID=UPI0025EAE67E|nr:prolipoprotein diacylglyceryl transferase [Sphingomonas sp.]